jgi:hypothetical protein
MVSISIGVILWIGGALDLWISVLSLWTGYHCGEISSTDSEYDLWIYG